ncbi:MAG: electron transport complex subunit RsxD [Porticoccaceae bacterium]|nr:electron transport complex subunit RsxD [Porticoccaceae bacterium]
MSILVLNTPNLRGLPTKFLVILACLPGFFALSWCFGWGVLLNIVICVVSSKIFDAVALSLRGQSLNFRLQDSDTLLTAIFIGLSLPPLCPWWLPVIGCSVAILIGKHAYGGIGASPFNPAMIGYATLLLCFPFPMSQWVAMDVSNSSDAHYPTLIESIKIIVGHMQQFDGVTGATPLESLRQNNGLLINQLYSEKKVFSEGVWAGVGWEWINLSFLLGGVFLIITKIITWHAPSGMLGSIVVLSLVFWDSGSSASLGSPIFHLFSGATMLGAFFIITDPVSSAASARGRLAFGILIGVLVFFLRGWSDYPDGLAFAVLIANFTAPTIDKYLVMTNNKENE